MTGRCPVCTAEVDATPSPVYDGLAQLAPHDNHLVGGTLIPPPCIGGGAHVQPSGEPS